MKHVLIIEDEQVTANNLLRMLLRYDPEFHIFPTLTSVHAAIDWLANHEPPSLIFLDVQLGDGLSFEIFEDIDVSTPVIFTTAYHEYIQKAFELNSIDYLLKPISFDRLKLSLDKFRKLYDSQHVARSAPIKQLITQIDWQKPTYKSRFLVKVGKLLRVVTTEEIAYFTKDGIVTLIDFSGNKYAVNYSLDELTKMLDPSQFFRINRQQLIHLNSIEEIHQDGHQLSVYLKPHPFSHSIVSQRNGSAFKKWLEGN
ncbi:MAG: LytR/AlgR family response regulator transcription factor [Flammeovirgaceae bacterium]